MKQFIIFPMLFLYGIVAAQSVGIGTTSPNSSSILDLGAGKKPLILPRLSSVQMYATTNAELGMVVYNTTEQQLYTYMEYLPGANRWQPVSTGPRMLAWGVIDSFANTINGSQTFSIAWDNVNRWYRFTLSNSVQYYKDSMLLMITPVGGGAWDQMPSTTDFIDGSNRIALIKFSDASRIAAGAFGADQRRRSLFHFVLYDLRKTP